jgi:prevent-host-death family protein
LPRPGLELILAGTANLASVRHPWTAKARRDPVPRWISRGTILDDALGTCPWIVPLDLVHSLVYLHPVMKTTTVNIHEAKTHLSRLLARVVKGEEIVIAKAGTPLARLVPVQKRRTMADAFDLYRGQVWIAPDFDASLPEDVQAGFEGRDARPA